MQFVKIIFTSDSYLYGKTDSEQDNPPWTSQLLAYLQYLYTAIKLQSTSQSVQEYDQTIEHILQLPGSGETEPFVRNVGGSVDQCQ
jgi:hypothetical protein